MELLLKYFPYLTDSQLSTFSKARDLFIEWNQKINIISRKDIGNIVLHHFLHSLSLVKYFPFRPQTSVLDVGTGGGFPGIPLAILYPDVEFFLMDSIAKKVRVVEEISKFLGLSNVHPLVKRVDDWKQKHDFITARAVIALPEFCRLVTKNISSDSFNDFPNGILYLKGGDFDNELNQIQLLYRIINLNDFFDEEFFRTKKLVHLYRG